MNKVWFVTGASRGIGFEVAKAVLASGDKVVATARKSEGLAASLGGDEGNLLALPLDVSDKDAIGEAVRAAIAHFGTRGAAVLDLEHLTVTDAAH